MGAQRRIGVARRWWIQTVPGLSEDTTAYLLREPTLPEALSLSKDESAVFHVLNALAGAPASGELIAELCRTHYRSAGMSAATAEQIVDRFCRQRIAFERPAEDDSPQRPRPPSFVAATRAAQARVQLEVLRERVAQVYQEVPFYQRHWAHLDPGRLRALAELPIVTKEDVRRNLPDLLSRGGMSHLGRKDWRSTSGTTGDRLQMVALHSYLHQSACAVTFPSPIFANRRAYLTTPLCSGTECHAELDLPFEERLRGRLREVLFLNTGANPTRFSLAKLRAMVDDLRRFRATYLIADAAYAVALARHMATQHLVMPMRQMLLSYSVASARHVRALETAFQCEARDYYASMEFGGMALGCEEGGLHAPASHVILEVLDRDLRPVAPGQLGRVYITTLGKPLAPLFRYRTADVARARESCACDDSQPAIGGIEGRVDDLIQSVEGSWVTPRMVDRCISSAATGEFGWYSLEQVEASAYVLYLVGERDHSPGDADALRQSLCEVLGQRARIDIRCVPELLPGPSGKYRLCHMRDPLGPRADVAF